MLLASDILSCPNRPANHMKGEIKLTGTVIWVPSVIDPRLLLILISQTSLPIAQFLCVLWFCWAVQGLGARRQGAEENPKNIKYTVQ